MTFITLNGSTNDRNVSVTNMSKQKMTEMSQRKTTQVAEYTQRVRCLAGGGLSTYSMHHVCRLIVGRTQVCCRKSRSLYLPG